MRNRYVIGQIFLIQIIFFKKRDMTEQSLNCLGENTRQQRQLVYNVSYGGEKCRPSSVSEEK